jgi:glucokinase
MRSILFNGQKVLADYSLATPKDNLDHFLIMAQALVEPLIEKAKNEKLKIEGIGISLAGVPDINKQSILKSPNIAIIDGIKIPAILESKLNLPIKLDNDANCFLRAEIKFGAVHNMNNVYAVIIGTGIGGAWWFNNTIYNGSHGVGSEPGRMIIDFSNKTQLEESYQKLNQNNPGKLAEEAYRGDDLAEKTFDEIGEILGIAFANIANLIDPEAIIIGGGVVGSSDLFLSEIKKLLKKYIMSKDAKSLKILKSKLGKNAGAIGAALLFE